MTEDKIKELIEKWEDEKIRLKNNYRDAEKFNQPVSKAMVFAKQMKVSEFLEDLQNLLKQ